MDERTALKGLGLSEGEVTVYLSLLKLGQTTVSELTKETGQHRTTIYDFLEHLLEKGLVSYIVQQNTKYYQAAAPTKLLEVIQEKEQNIKKVLPQLQKLIQFKKEDIRVEVYKGKEGFKTLINSALNIGKTFYGFGIDEYLFEEVFPLELQRYFKREQEIGMQEYNLTRENPKFVYPYKHVHYASIPDEFFDPTPTAVFGNQIWFMIWEPFTCILIENKNLAESYRRYHKMLWKMAKPITQKDIEKKNRK